MAVFADYLTSVADILTSTLAEDGQVRVNLGDATTGEGWASEAPMWGLDGFVSRPNDSSADGAAQGLYLVEGDTKRVIASRDNRWASKAGSLKPGDRAIVSDCAARLFLKQSTSSLVLYTENQQDADSSMIVELNGQAGSFRVIVGKAYLLMEGGEIKIGVGGSCFVLTEEVIAAFGKHFAANTASGNLGLMGGAAPTAANGIASGPQPGLVSASWTVTAP